MSVSIDQRVAQKESRRREIGGKDIFAAIRRREARGREAGKFMICIGRILIMEDEDIIRDVARIARRKGKNTIV